LYFIDESERNGNGIDIDQRTQQLADEVHETARRALPRDSNRVLRSVTGFLAGVAFGAALGLLFAPASGTDTRRIVADKIHRVGAGARSRFRRELERLAG
jgi:hypothetical protein